MKSVDFLFPVKAAYALRAYFSTSRGKSHTQPQKNKLDGPLFARLWTYGSQPVTSAPSMDHSYVTPIEKGDRI